MRLHNGLLVAVVAALTLTVGCQESGTTLIVKAETGTEKLEFVLFVADQSVTTDASTVWQRQVRDDDWQKIKGDELAKGFRIMLSGEAQSLRVAVVAWDESFGDTPPVGIDKVWFATSVVNVSSSGPVREYTLEMKSQAFGRSELVVGDTCEVNSDDGVYLHRVADDTLCLGWQLGNLPANDQRGVFLVDALDADCDGTVPPGVSNTECSNNDEFQCDPEVPDTEVSTAVEDLYGCVDMNCDGVTPGDPCVFVNEFDACVAGATNCQDSSLMDCVPKDQVEAVNCPSDIGILRCNESECSGSTIGLTVCKWPVGGNGSGQTCRTPFDFNTQGTQISDYADKPCKVKLWGGPRDLTNPDMVQLGLTPSGSMGAPVRELDLERCAFQVIGAANISFNTIPTLFTPLMVSVDFEDPDITDVLLSSVIGYIDVGECDQSTDQIHCD